MFIKSCIFDTYFSTNIKKANNVVSAFKNICATYGELFLSELICRKWFTKFREGMEKAGLHSKKAILCIWCHCKRPIYYELLPMNKTINSEKYCAQLEILKAAIEEKLPV